MRSIDPDRVNPDWLRERLDELNQECKRRGVSLLVLAKEADAVGGWVPEEQRSALRAIPLGDLMGAIDILALHAGSIAQQVTAQHRVEPRIIFGAN